MADDRLSKLESEVKQLKVDVQMMKHYSVTDSAANEQQELTLGLVRFIASFPKQTNTIHHR